MNLAKLSLIVFSIILISACASHKVDTTTRFTSYEDFESGPEGGVDLVWVREDLKELKRFQSKMNAYDSIVIDQIVVVTEEGEINEEAIKEITDYLKSTLSNRVAAFKEVIDKPKDTSLRISIALSNIETPNPVLAFTSTILPVGLAISAVSKVTTGEHRNVGSASIEMLISDATTGESLFAAIDRESGSKDLSTMVDSLDDIKEAIDYWIERLGIALDEWKPPE